MRSRDLSYLTDLCVCNFSDKDSLLIVFIPIFLGLASVRTNNIHMPRISFINERKQSISDEFDLNGNSNSQNIYQA